MTQFNKPPNTIYVIRKGDMVIRPTFDDINNRTAQKSSNSIPHEK